MPTDTLINKKQTKTPAAERKPGFKHTAFGWIPEEWEVKKIQELLDDNSILSHLDGNHGDLYPSSEDFTDTGVPYIAANNFLDGNVNFDGCKCLPEEKAKLFKKGVAINGDVLFAHNATVGPVALLKTKFEYIILSTTATYFRCNKDKLSNLFFQFVLQAPFFIKQYESIMAQSTRNQVPITAQRKLSVLIPPLPEQQSIAAVLITSNNAIEKLEQLITQKELYKKVLMQQLLTGKRRLKGFNGEWKEVHLGDACKIRTGKLDVNAMVEKGEYPFFTCAKEIFWIDQFAFDTEALLVSGNGEHVGYIHYYKGKFNAYQRTYVLNDFHENIFFILYYLQNFLGQRINREKNAGNTPYIVLGTLADMEIKLPSLKEQSAIADALLTADKEISLLNKKLEALKAQKKGLMQVLLTGKVRVKIQTHG